MSKLSISPHLQAWIDMRDEGAFHPSQYPAGSIERQQYEQAQHEIEQREQENVEVSESRP
jgi:hypothetical protein